MTDAITEQVPAIVIGPVAVRSVRRESGYATAVAAGFQSCVRHLLRRCSPLLRAR